MDEIKQIKDMTNWEVGKLIARRVAFWASEEHSRLVQARLKKGATISAEKIAEMAGEMRAYIRIMEEASTLENMCKLYQERAQHGREH